MIFAGVCTVLVAIGRDQYKILCSKNIYPGVASSNLIRTDTAVPLNPEKLTKKYVIVQIYLYDLW